MIMWTPPQIVFMLVDRSSRFIMNYTTINEYRLLVYFKKAQLLEYKSTISDVFSTASLCIETTTLLNLARRPQQR